MTKTFLQRRQPHPKYDVVACITGTDLGDGKIYWDVEVEGESDNITAVGILTNAAAVLRKPENECG